MTGHRSPRGQAGVRRRKGRCSPMVDRWTARSSRLASVYLFYNRWMAMMRVFKILPIRVFNILLQKSNISANDLRLFVTKKMCML